MISRYSPLQQPGWALDKSISNCPHLSPNTCDGGKHINNNMRGLERQRWRSNFNASWCATCQLKSVRLKPLNLTFNIYFLGCCFKGNNKKKICVVFLYNRTRKLTPGLVCRYQQVFQSCSCCVPTCSWSLTAVPPAIFTLVNRRLRRKSTSCKTEPNWTSSPREQRVLVLKFHWPQSVVREFVLLNCPVKMCLCL